jgi:protein-disulfide isomerase
MEGRGRGSRPHLNLIDGASNSYPAPSAGVTFGLFRSPIPRGESLVSSLKKSNSKNFGAIIAVIAVAGLGAIGWVMSRPPKVITLERSAGVGLEAKGVVVGSADALVEVVEFADFECPGCGYFATIEEPDIMARLVATGEVRFRFMDFPLDMHRNAVAAHSAAACANEQGKFWEMHDGIFRNQERWNSQVARDPKRALQQIAKDAGVEVGAWEDCYDSGRTLPQIEANRRAGEQLRVGSTPSFKIGDQIIPGSLTYDQMRGLVAAEKVRIMANRSLDTGKPVTVDEAKKSVVPVTP